MTGGSMEHFDIAQSIREVSTRLGKAPRAITDQAKKFAEAERIYRMELAKEITRLRSEGLQSTLIADVARGNVADFKYKRDLEEGMYKACIESSKALQAELSGLQSILKVMTDV